VQNNNNFSG